MNTRRRMHRHWKRRRQSHKESTHRARESTITWKEIVMEEHNARFCWERSWILSRTKRIYSFKENKSRKLLFSLTDFCEFLSLSLSFLTRKGLWYFLLLREQLSVWSFLFFLFRVLRILSSHSLQPFILETTTDTEENAPFFLSESLFLLYFLLFFLDSLSQVSFCLQWIWELKTPSSHSSSSFFISHRLHPVYHWKEIHFFYSFCGILHRLLLLFLRRVFVCSRLPLIPSPVVPPTIITTRIRRKLCKVWSETKTAFYVCLIYLVSGLSSLSSNTKNPSLKVEKP